MAEGRVVGIDLGTTNSLVAYMEGDAPVVIPAAAELQTSPAGIKVVAIGTSTGGPPVLQTILSKLPKDLPVPVLITQHIAVGFLAGMAEWLRQTTGFRVLIAAQGEPLRPGHAYLAPDGFHLGVDGAARFALSVCMPSNSVQVSVTAAVGSDPDVYIYDTNSAGFVKKGSHILVTGTLKSRQYEREGVTHTVWEIHAREMLLLDPRASTANEETPRPEPTQS